MIKLFFNIMFLISISILVIHQSFYYYQFNKILKKLKILSEEKNIRKDRNLILEYNYNLAQLNYIFCVYFCGLLKKILYKKNNFEYVE